MSITEKVIMIKGNEIVISHIVPDAVTTGCATRQDKKRTNKTLRLINKQQYQINYQKFYEGKYGDTLFTLCPIKVLNYLRPSPCHITIIVLYLFRADTANDHFSSCPGHA